MSPSSAFALLVLVASGATSVHAQEATTSLFVRGDSDRTTVVSPRGSARATLEATGTEVTAAYSADIWTSASIDIRTAATRAVTEQRDQIDLSVTQALNGDVDLGVGYYFSDENDYTSQGATLRSQQELLGNRTTLEESVRWVYDEVGRSGDLNFRRRRLHTFSGRLVLTQVLSPDAIVQAVYEGAFRLGFQSSPYRFVGLGGDGRCDGGAVLCLPEAHPNTRQRNALVLQGRYAIGSNASAGLGYRFYLDDWGVLGHTANAQIAFLPTSNTTVTFRYRFHTQSAAGFYRSIYPMAAGAVRYVTRDRELSPLFSNRVAVAYEATLRLDATVALRLSAAVGGTVFAYPDFVGLDEVLAGDLTVAATLEL